MTMYAFTHIHIHMHSRYRQLATCWREHMPAVLWEVRLPLEGNYQDIYIIMCMSLSLGQTRWMNNLPHAEQVNNLSHAEPEKVFQSKTIAKEYTSNFRVQNASYPRSDWIIEDFEIVILHIFWDAGMAIRGLMLTLACQLQFHACVAISRLHGNMLNI